MVSSMGRLSLFLAAGIVVALLPLGVAEAKDWKPGDTPGFCPGTWDPKDGKCKRPYLCEPTRCYACYASVGNKCTQCGVYDRPGCKGTGKPVKLPGASSVTAPSQPSDETVTGRYKPVTHLGVHHTQ